MHISAQGIIAIVLSYIYIFYNGANDRANAIATTVATRALPPFWAIAWTSALNFAGAFLTTEVAKTVGKDIIPPEHMSYAILISALVGAIVWLFFATSKGIPVSVTHALVGGLVGAGIAQGGIGILGSAGLTKVAIGILLAPTLGFAGAFILVLISTVCLRNVSMWRINRWSRIGQILSGGAVSFTHGMNDTQNGMGVIAATLLLSGSIATFYVPTWVIISSGFVMGIGTFVAGWGVMHTLGRRLAHLKPLHGVSAETNTALILFMKSLLGIPASTTHVITGAIMGAGVGGLAGGINWVEFAKIVISWLLTFIVTGGIAAAILVCIKLFS